MIIKDIIKNVSTKLIVYSIIGAVLIGGFFFIRHKIFEDKFKSLEMLVSARLVECAELCVFKYEYESMIKLQTSALFGYSTSDYSANFKAVVRAGISNMQNVKFRIADKGKTIIIYLPKIEVLSNDTMDEGQVLVDSEGFFARKIKKQEVLDAIKDSKKKRLEELLSTPDFLYKAETQIQNIMNEQFTVMGFQEIIFK